MLHTSYGTSFCPVCAHSTVVAAWLTEPAPINCVRRKSLQDKELSVFHGTHGFAGRKVCQKTVCVCRGGRGVEAIVFCSVSSPRREEIREVCEVLRGKGLATHRLQKISREAACEAQNR